MVIQAQELATASYGDSENVVSDLSSDVFMVAVVAVVLYLAGVSLRFFLPNVSDGSTGRSFLWAIPGEQALLRRHSIAPSYGTLHESNATPTYEDLLALQDAVGHVESGLDPDQINIFPTTNFSKGDNLEEAPMCPICLEHYGEDDILRILPCSERFHRE